MKMIKGNMGNISFKYNDCSNKYVIACHGFATDKDGGTISSLAERLDEIGVGLLAFDFPAHGESNVKSEDLRIADCVNNIKTVYDYIKEGNENAEISIFGSSFGAYIALLATAKFDCLKFENIILRCAAVDFNWIIENVLIPEAEELNKDNSFKPEEGHTQIGFSRVVINNRFIEEAKENNIYEIYSNMNRDNRIMFIHGDEDTTAPKEHVDKFITIYPSELITIAGAGHMFENAGAKDMVIEHILNVFKDSKPNTIKFKSLMSSVSDSKNVLEALKEDLMCNIEELHRARQSYESKYTFEYYDEFLIKYMEAIECKIDAIIKHARAIEEEISDPKTEVSELYNLYKNKTQKGE